jgi:ABC-type nitrate/sulfonate/bicarbonate transport system ATPase subunit
MLIVKNLSVSYGDQIILCDINLEVAKGQFVSIIGKSGCGKTTLLNAIAGFELPHFIITGEIAKPKNIGYIFQESSLLPWMTVRQNLIFGAKDRDFNIEKFLTSLGLGGKSDFYPNELSGGQKQKLALGQTILNNPELILMDEPFGSLDDISRSKSWIWLQKTVKEYELTVIMVTHSLREAKFLSDKIYKIE